MHRREALLHIDHRFNEHTYRDKRNHFDEGYPPSFVTRHTRRLRTQLCERRQHFTVAGKPAGTRGRGGEPSPAAASQGRNYSAGSDQSRPKIPSEHFERGLFVFQVYACCYLAGPWGPSGRGSVPNSSERCSFTISIVDSDFSERKKSRGAPVHQLGAFFVNQRLR